MLSSNNAYFLAGNVGIGLNSPTHRLDVQSAAIGQDAIAGRHVGTVGATNGVAGASASTLGRGVYGTNTATSGAAYGVYGESKSPAGRAVYGSADTGSPSNASNAAAIYGAASGQQVTGVHGSAIGATGYVSRGVHGFVSTTSGYAVYAQGRFTATSNKGFTQPHPTDASKNVFFVCLEGNENGTYFRGTTRLIGGRAEIPIPEEWRLVTEEKGITVQVTPKGPAVLYVAEESRERIVVKGTADVEFHYFVNGVRRGFADYQPFTQNHGFRPMVRGVPFGTQYPTALRQILVENGTLNADFTPNEATAQRLGWKLLDPDAVPLVERYWLTDTERAELRRKEQQR